MSPDNRTDKEVEKAKDDQPENPDDGPSMSQAGAMPGGSEMAHWNTAMPNPDATRPETMPSSSKQKDPKDDDK